MEFNLNGEFDANPEIASETNMLEKLLMKIASKQICRKIYKWKLLKDVEENIARIANAVQCHN